MKLQQPWPDGYSVNARSPYGWRKHPITGRRTFHHGVDVALPVGTPLTAPADGVVVKKGSGGSGGFTLIVKHADDLFTVYYHLQKPSSKPVNARVFVGEVIAYSGNTGASTGPHLHWEVRKSARWGDTVDPMPYLSATPPQSATPIPVTGRMDRATWKALQSVLKAHGHYHGLVDGKPGPLTYTALQAWALAPQSGVLNEVTKRRVQERLGVKVDGVWGRLTVSELQRRLNDGSL